MEAHKRIRQLVAVLSCNVRVVEFLGHRVVDVKKRHGVFGNDRPDELGERPVDVHLARDGNSSAR